MTVSNVKPSTDLEEADPWAPNAGNDSEGPGSLLYARCGPSS